MGEILYSKANMGFRPARIKLILLIIHNYVSVINTNLKGTFQLTQSVFKACMKENGGSIVNILMQLEGGWPGMAHSVSSRAGVEALSKTLAVEWGKSYEQVI